MIPAYPKPKPKPRHHKKTERQRLVEKLDRLTSEIVINRDRKCVTCGVTRNLSCGHLITRARYGVRWDLQNCAAQCFACNALHESDPEPYKTWFILRYGESALEELKIKSKLGKFTLFEMKKILADLKEYRLFRETI